jgi:hypothetical protein
MVRLLKRGGYSGLLHILIPSIIFAWGNSVAVFIKVFRHPEDKGRTFGNSGRCRGFSGKIFMGI